MTSHSSEPSRIPESIASCNWTDARALLRILLIVCRTVQANPIVLRVCSLSRVKSFVSIEEAIPGYIITSYYRCAFIVFFIFPFRQIRGPWVTAKRGSIGRFDCIVPTVAEATTFTALHG